MRMTNIPPWWLFMLVGVLLLEPAIIFAVISLHRGRVRSQVGGGERIGNELVRELRDACYCHKDFHCLHCDAAAEIERLEGVHQEGER